MSPLHRTHARALRSSLAADPSWGEPRNRTITWYEPMQVAAASRSMSGLELLEAVRDSRVPPPPIGQRFQPGSHIVEPGRVEVSCLRPVHGTCVPLVAVGTVAKPGRRVTSAEGSVTDAAGKLMVLTT